jgi:hypothetical protein
MENIDLDIITKQLETNNFEVFLAENIQAAKHIFKNKILENLKISSISYADSITMHKTGIYEDIRATPLFLSLTYKSYEDVGAKAPKQKKGRSPINFVENNANDRIRYIALKPSSKKYGKIE